MPKIEIKDSFKSVDLVSNSTIPIQNSIVVNLIESIGQFNHRLRVNRIFWEYSGEPNKYNYSIATTDNRLWSQIIEFLDGMEKEPYMTFGVLGKWKLSEFNIQRPVRDVFVGLTQTFGLTKCECIWF